MTDQIAVRGLLKLGAFGVIFRSGGPPALTLVRAAPAQETDRDRAFLMQRATVVLAQTTVVSFFQAVRKFRWV